MASLELQNRFERRYRIGHGSWISTQPCHDEDDAFVAMVEAPATSLPGLSAKLAYLQGLGSELETEWMIEDRADAGALVRSFAASIANVMAVLSRRITPHRSSSCSVPVRNPGKHSPSA